MSDPVIGMPGLRPQRTATYRRVFKSADGARFLPTGRVIDGSRSRDVDHDDIDVLRPGMLMGKVTSTGRYAPSILGALTGAYTATGTTMNVAPAAALELVRRIGAAGSFTLTGPPTAAGEVASETITYSAVNTTTGAITVTASDADYVSGSLVQPTDGSESALSFVPDGYGIKVTDADGQDVDVPMPLVPVAGTVDSTQIINWPSDTSLQQQIKIWLNAAGQFVFDDAY